METQDSTCWISTCLGPCLAQSFGPDLHDSTCWSGILGVVRSQELGRSGCSPADTGSNVSHGLDPPYLIFGLWVISHQKGWHPWDSSNQQCTCPAPAVASIVWYHLHHFALSAGSFNRPYEVISIHSAAKNSVCQASKCFCVPYTTHKMMHWFRKLKWNDWGMRKNTEYGGGDNSPHLISTKHQGVRTLWQGHSTPCT